MRQTTAFAVVPLALVCLALTAGTALAQATTAPVETTTRPQKALTGPAAPGHAANVRIEVTITDQTGPGEPVTKVVTLLLADNANGSIRTRGSVRNQGPVQINVDARPIILAGGQVRIALGLEYNPRVSGADAAVESSSLHEQVSVVVESGKPLVISQAADPVSDRKISVELKATILR